MELEGARRPDYGYMEQYAKFSKIFFKKFETFYTILRLTYIKGICNTGGVYVCCRRGHKTDFREVRGCD